MPHHVKDGTRRILLGLLAVAALSVASFGLTSRAGVAAAAQACDCGDFIEPIQGVPADCWKWNGPCSCAVCEPV